MMKLRLKKYINIIKATTLIIVVSACILPLCSVAYGSDYTNCIPNSQNGKWTLECPNGQQSRNDVNVGCVREQNKNSCLNTMPVSGSVARIPEDVCYRNEGWSKKRNHNGIDYAVAAGTPVVAAAAGTAQVNQCVSGGGRTVVIVHKKATSPSSDGVDIVPNSSSDYYTTIYMHLSSIAVSDGAQVQKGQVIGNAGGSSCSNGVIIENAYGAHLHFEMRDGSGGVASGNVLDPLCNEIQSLCETSSTNAYYQNSSGYDTFQCRDCTKNQEACRKTDTGGYDHENGDPINPTTNGQSVGGTGEEGNCSKMYDENNLLALSAAGESGNNPGINNKCAKGDSGGCSYGSNQMACGAEKEGKQSSGGTVATFLRDLSSRHPDLFAQLSNGNDVETTIKYACNNLSYPNENLQFRTAWESLGSNKDFALAQDEFIYNQFVSYPKNACGSEWDKLTPEVKMTLMACAIAAPATVIKVIKQIKNENPSTPLSEIPEETIIPRINLLRVEIGYHSYKVSDDPNKQSIYNAVLKRAPEDDERALTSAKLRKALADPANAGKTPDEISIELTGKRMCAADEYPGVSSYDTGSGGGSGTSSGANEKYDSDKDCRVSKYRNSFSGCMFCGIFKTLFNAASLIAKNAYNALSGAALTLMLVGTALWLAFTVLKQVSSLGGANPYGMVKTIVNQLFVVLCCAVMLLTMDSTAIMNLLINPIFQTGMDFSKLLLANSSGETCNSADIAGIRTDGGLPESIGTSILCIIDTIQNKLLDIIALGSSSICVGFWLESYKNLPIFPHFGYVITGVFLWLTGVMFMVIYPWLLIDSMLNLCLAVAFLPLAIAGYPYKVTRGMFVKKVWGAFMSAMFTFVFLSVVIAVLLMAIENVVGESGVRSLSSVGDSGSAYKNILSSIGWWTMNFLKLVFILFLGWAVLGEAKSFAENFASGMGAGGGAKLSKGIAADIGGMTAKATNRAVKGAVNRVGTGAKIVGHSIKENAQELASDFRLNLNKDHVDNRMNQIQNQGTLNADGTRTYRNMFGRKFTATQDGYSYKNWRGKTITKTVERNDNGNVVYTKSKTNKNGTTTSVSQDGFIKQTAVYASNGQMISKKSEMTTAGGKSLINKDGTVNEIAINAIMQNSAFNPDDVQSAILEQMLKERIPSAQYALQDDFQSRQIVRGKDENGHDFFKIIQKNKDGSTTNVSMTFGNNGRVMTEIENISRKGEAIKHSSDGIINRIQRYNYKKDGTIDENSIESRYSATKYYVQNYGKVIDSNGRAARGVPIEDTLFKPEDIREMGDKVARNGTAAPLEGFK